MQVLVQTAQTAQGMLRVVMAAGQWGVCACLNWYQNAKWAHSMYGYTGITKERKKEGVERARGGSPRSDGLSCPQPYRNRESGTAVAFSGRCTGGMTRQGEGSRLVSTKKLSRAA